MKQSSLDLCVWCTILSCTCYFPCFWGEFVYDDIVAVQNNPDVRSETGLKGVIELFVHDFWGGSLWVNTWSHLSYRPLTVLSFRLNYSFHGLHVLGYHIVNVVLHSAVCVQVGVLAKKLEKYFMNLEEQQPSSKKQWCSALLFCVHPVCSEAVANIVGRAEILSAFLSISALISFLDVDMRASTSKKDKLQAYFRICVLCMAAVLSKESGLTAPLLMLSIPTARYLTAPKSLFDKPLWKRSVFPLCLGAILFWGRMWFTTGYSLVMSQRFNPIHELPMGIYKLASIGYIQAYAVSLLVMPWILCHTHSSFPLIRALWDLRNLMTLIFFSLVLWFVYYSVSKKRPFMLFSLLWIGCSFLPASHVFFRVGFVIAERTLYVPAIGFVFFLISFSGLDDEEANFWVTFEGNLKTVICQKNEKSLFNQECSSSSMQHVSDLAMFVGKHIQTEESLQSSRWRGPTARRRVRKGGGGGGGGPPCKVNPPCPLGFARRRRLLWCLGAAAWARARRRAHAWAGPEPLYASALRTYPGDAGVLHALGHRALFSSSASDKYNLAVAMEYLSRAVNARSDHGTAWGQLGRAFHLQGDYPQALACARAAAKAGASEYLTNAGAAQIAISGTLNGSLSAFQAARRNSLSDNDPRNSNVENNFGAIQLAVLCGSGISFQEILESSFAAKAVTEAKKSFIKAQQLQIKVTNCSYELAVVFSNLSIAEMLRCEGLASAILWNQKAIDLFYQIMASSGSRKPSPLDTSYGQKKAKLHSARESDSSYEFSLSKALEVQSVLENLGHCQQQQGQNSDQGTAVCTNSNNSHVVDCTLFGSLDWLGPMLQLVIL